MNFYLFIAFVGAMSILCSCANIGIIGINRSIPVENRPFPQKVWVALSIFVVLVTVLGLIIILGSIKTTGNYIILLLVLPLFVLIADMRYTAKLKKTKYNLLYATNIIFVFLNVSILLFVVVVMLLRY